MYAFCASSVYTSAYVSVMITCLERVSVASPFRLPSASRQPREPRLACIKQTFNASSPPRPHAPRHQAILWPQSALTFPRSESSSSLGSSSDEHVFSISNTTASSKRTRKRFTGFPARHARAALPPRFPPVARTTRITCPGARFVRTLSPPSSLERLTWITREPQGRDDMVPESPPERA
jgi:hypothetical protein